MALFLHHLVRIHLSVLQGDAQHVGSCGQLAHVYGLEAIALRANQAALEVVELEFDGLNVGLIYVVKSLFIIVSGNLVLCPSTYRSIHHRWKG